MFCVFFFLEKEKTSPAGASIEGEKYFRSIDSIDDISCDGILQGDTTPNSRHDKEHDKDGDETQSLPDPSPIKQNETTLAANNDNLDTEELFVVLFTDSEKNDKDDDEFDQQLIAQAINSKQLQIQDENDEPAAKKKKKMKKDKAKKDKKLQEKRCTCKLYSICHIISVLFVFTRTDKS